jgi:VIT1/CCC1 family predicted Fe2+/Mn2+ transporter
MDVPEISSDLRNRLLIMQRDEISSYHTYLKLAELTRDPHNRETLHKIAGQEQRHYQTWKRYTRTDVRPDALKIRFYFWTARLLGLTFGIKLMEKGEEKAQAGYRDILLTIPEIEEVLREEETHETELIDMLDEESLKYAGSVVLGLNDALVELTGALAGLTFAFQNTRLIALAGLITGISASMSMAASEYLSTRASGEEQNPIKSALYTGIAYIFTVVFLVLPYLLMDNYLICLAWTLVHAILIIAVFNYYISVARDLPFRRRFVEMAAISLGVAILSFVIGNVIRRLFGIEV